ncbi:MAG: helix-turn-helix domain-containing protein [Mailhella sp.]|nr:helix-turn-helix domain-containing protein [Mailhella sp.]
MQSFEAVYARMLFAAGVRTQTELAKILDMKQASISEGKKRGSIPAEWCMRLYDACGVNFDWQRFGIGPVYDAAKLKEIEGFRRGEWYEPPQEDVPLQLHEPDTPFYPFAVHDETPVHSVVQMPDGSFPEVLKQVFPSEFLPAGAKVFRLLNADMSPVLNKGAMVAVLQGASAVDGDVVAVFEGRQLCFRRAHRAEDGWTVEAAQEQGARFIPDEEWPIYYYGKAVWAFQPL